MYKDILNQNHDILRGKESSCQESYITFLGQFVTEILSRNYINKDFYKTIQDGVLRYVCLIIYLILNTICPIIYVPLNTLGKALKGDI